MTGSRGGVGGDFLGLDRGTLADAYAFAAEKLVRNQTAIEKDVWVCWTLNALFSTPGRPTLAFKGGTSLSKCHDAIKRFSEDVDVTMQLTDVDLAALTRNLRAKTVEALREEMVEKIATIFFPYMQGAASAVGAQLTIENNGEELHLVYPSALDERESYYREVVKIEFGARAGTDPSTRRTLTPYIAPLFGTLTFPTAEVDVLDAERTFWEKVTLAHAASGRAEFKNHERFSRHWYDLAMLARHDISDWALADLDLLDAVVIMKHAHYRVGGVDYNDCATGNASLIPSAAGLKLLEADYVAMCKSGMIEGIPLTFTEVVAGVRDIEQRANAATSGRTAPIQPTP